MARPETAGGQTPAAGIVVSYALVTVLWGLNWPAMKAAVDHFDPWTFRLLVLVLAGATLFGLAALQGHRLTLPREQRWAILLPAATVTAWHMFSAYGVAAVGGGRAAIIAFTMPLWTMLLSIWLLGERPTLVRVAALALGLLGLGLLLVDDLENVGRAPAGVLLMFGGALAWAVGTVAVKMRDWQVSILVLTAWQLVLGVVPIGLIWAWRGADADLAGIPASAWTGFLYCTFVAMVFCFYSYIRFVTLLPATVAAIGVMAIPVVGVVSSALLLGEPLGVIELSALALVVGGQALATSSGR